MGMRGRTNLILTSGVFPDKLKGFPKSDAMFSRAKYLSLLLSVSILEKGVKFRLYLLFIQNNYYFRGDLLCEPLGDL